jgi:hypothetical protein
MRQRRSIHAPLAGVLILSLLLVGYAPAAAQSTPEGVSEPGQWFHPALAAQVDDAADDDAAVDDARAVPRGSDLSPAQLDALKDAADRGDLTADESADVDVNVDVDESSAAAAGDSLAPVPVSEFAGIAYTGSIPPDPHLAVGPTDLVEVVNRTVRIASKAGATLANTSLATWFSNVEASAGTSFFDPWVVYDQQSARFVLLALAKNNSTLRSRFLISISTNNSAAPSAPGAGWCNYSLNARLNGSTATNNWADYAKVGFNNNAVVISANMFSPFTSPSTFQYAKLRFLSKSQLYNMACPAVNWHDFWNLTNPDGSKEFTVQPAHSFVASNFMYTLSARSSSGTNLTRRLYTTSATIPPAPVLSSKVAITVNSYSIPPDAEQPGTTTRIDTGDARLLNFVRQSNGRGWATHTVACTFSGDPTTRSCLRWYEVNLSGNTIIQQRSYGASGAYTYFPAIMPRSTSDAMIVFNRSSSATFAGIRYTGRKSTDLPNELQGSALLEGGQGCYIKLDTASPPRNRWGDYNGIALDPSVAGRWWIYSEYVVGTSATCGNNVWGTRVGQVGLQ